MSSVNKSVANITRYLKGIKFPARKTDLLKCAIHNGADEDVLKIISGMEDCEYRVMADVMIAYGQMKKALSLNA